MCLEVFLVHLFPRAGAFKDIAERDGLGLSCEQQARKSYERDLAAIRRADVAAEATYVTEDSESRPAAPVQTSQVAASSTPRVGTPPAASESG